MTDTTEKDTTEKDSNTESGPGTIVPADSLAARDVGRLVQVTAKSGAVVTDVLTSIEAVQGLLFLGFANVAPQRERGTFAVDLNAGPRAFPVEPSTPVTVWDAPEKSEPQWPAGRISTVTLHGQTFIPATSSTVGI